jgi:hypothetical protein
LPEQAETWGFPDIEFEEFYPQQSPTQTYLPLLKDILKDKKTGYYEQTYTSKFYDRVNFVPEHVLPYLATLLSPLHRKLRCGYCGIDPAMFSLFAQMWKRFGFTGEVMLFKVTEDIKPLESMVQSILGYTASVCDLADIDEKAELLIFDVGNLGTWEYQKRVRAESWEKEVMIYLNTLARKERKEMQYGKTRMRKYVIINSVCTEIEHYAQKYLAAVRTPFGSHVRHGYVVLPEKQAG